MARVQDVEMPMWQGCEMKRALLAIEARQRRLRDAAKADAALLLVRSTPINPS